MDLLVAALALAATSGAHNAGVATLIDLVIIVPIAVHSSRSPGTERRCAGCPGPWCAPGLIFGPLSLYWLVPTFFALDAGTWRTGLEQH